MEKEQDNTLAIDVLAKAITIPGVKVNREEFLVNAFKKASAEKRNKVLKDGPVKAGFSREELKRIAKRIVNERSLTSSGASFAAGLPGGLAMVGTIPADTMQFYGITLRLAQEIAYLYGADDLWEDGDVDLEKVTNQLVLYCGVMFGVSGAGATLKLMSTALSKQALKKLPQKALTKTIYYPMIKRIALFFGMKMNKDIFAKGVSKAIPVIGGVVSGGLTLASMRPMGMRLVNEFDEVNFDYSEEDYRNDLEEVMDIIEADAKIIDAFDDTEEQEEQEESVAMNMPKEDNEGSLTQKIKEAKALLDEGLITEEEFKAIKSRIIAEI